MNGHEATRRVKRSPGDARVLIVTETSHTMSDDRENTIPLVSTGCAETPAATEPLVSPIAQFLSGKSGIP
jgi:DNA-binding NarL/FixJ family response regulator